MALPLGQTVVAGGIGPMECALKDRSLVNKKAPKRDWDAGNHLLYELCERGNLDPFTKIWWIGRTYSAAIERLLRKVGNELPETAAFYARVASRLRAESVDKQAWGLRSSGDCRLCLHIRMVGQIKGAAGDLDCRAGTARSFASKYLHFHAPEFFPIYDSISNNALKRILDCRKTNHKSGCREEHDEEYVALVRRIDCLIGRLNAIDDGDYRSADTLLQVYA